MKRTATLLLLVLAVLLNAFGQNVGTYTTLNGFYDYQSNGGALKYIAVNPTNQRIHVVYMATSDSPAVSGDPTRRTLYAYSTNDGTTWNNFFNLSIPVRRSGFPCIDLLATVNGYCPVIANHSIITGGTNSTSVFIDCPEAGGAFGEILPGLSFNDALASPQVACTSDSSIIVVGAGTIGGQSGIFVKRLDTSQTWIRLTSDTFDRYVAAASPTNRAAVLVKSEGNGVLLFESTDNGRTWPASPQTIYPPQRIVGPDTFQAFLGCDLAYVGNTSVAALHEYMTNSSAPTDSSRIVFWSQVTGLVVAADKRYTPGVVPNLNRPQTNHRTMGYPVIGVTGPRIVIAYQAFMRETSAAGFNYSDIFFTQSTNGGSSWFLPSINLTRTSSLDERYPSISRWNDPTPPYFAYMVWQEDREPGSSTVNDNAPLARTRQRFLRLPLVVDEVSERNSGLVGFRLEQNYPNPFNPTTAISYSLPFVKGRGGVGSLVTLKIYDVLGREITTLVNEVKPPGEYKVNWNASDAASGVYFYRLNAGAFVNTKRMLLIR